MVDCKVFYRMALNIALYTLNVRIDFRKVPYIVRKVNNILLSTLNEDIKRYNFLSCMVGNFLCKVPNIYDHRQIFGCISLCIFHVLPYFCIHGTLMGINDHMEVEFCSLYSILHLKDFCYNLFQWYDRILISFQLVLCIDNLNNFIHTTFYICVHNLRYVHIQFSTW